MDVASCRTACLEPGRILALLASLLLSMGLLACGENDTRTDPTVHRSLRSRAFAVRGVSADAPQAGRHLLGDYDNDDGRYVVRGTDGDNDDSTSPPDRDNDSDSNSAGRYDSDDGHVADFGHAAPPADRQAIVALVKRYYAAAVAGDGARACSLFFSPLARTYPKDLAEGSTRPYLHGLTRCPEVASRLFEQYHAQLSLDSATLRVTDVRLSGKLGLVVLGFTKLPSRLIEVMREGRRWTMYALLDSELP